MKTTINKHLSACLSSADAVVMAQQRFTGLNAGLCSIFTEELSGYI